MESCRFCNPLGDGEHQFIKKFACGNLYLNKSQHYYGYLVYIYHKHAKDFSEIDEADLLQVHQDLLYITKVVKRVFPETDLINIASLQNVVRHLHWHIIPRREGDANWGGPPWPYNKVKLPEDELIYIILRYQEEFNRDYTY